jgi:hypothetical protein
MNELDVVNIMVACLVLTVCILGLVAHLAGLA